MKPAVDGLPEFLTPAYRSLYYFTELLHLIRDNLGDETDRRFHTICAQAGISSTQYNRLLGPSRLVFEQLVSGKMLDRLEARFLPGFLDAAAVAKFKELRKEIAKAVAASKAERSSSIDIYSELDDEFGKLIAGRSLKQEHDWDALIQDFVETPRIAGQIELALKNANALIVGIQAGYDRFNLKRDQQLRMLFSALQKATYVANQAEHPSLPAFVDRWRLFAHKYADPALQLMRATAETYHFRVASRGAEYSGGNHQEKIIRDLEHTARSVIAPDIVDLVRLAKSGAINEKSWLNLSLDEKLNGVDARDEIARTIDLAIERGLPERVARALTILGLGELELGNEQAARTAYERLVPFLNDTQNTSKAAKAEIAFLGARLHRLASEPFLAEQMARAAVRLLRESSARKFAREVKQKLRKELTAG